MDEKRFSEMTTYELQTEIQRINEKAKKAEQLGMMNEFAVYERKMIMAKAYLLDPADFKPGELYSLTDDESTFQISYMNGRFAWGYRNNETSLDAVPISLLKQK
ncbi:YfhH family protein [Alkalihalophilus sp. As8PL]|uniref:YfhH family protein n=2 Tax=Alkalihalophilus TaxID=2893060 RepID=A0AB39BYB7_9BACI|nr:YfhH family protein [Alkalihalophilus lindianensis]MDV2685874.1 YfhH family protein [Alkalihalophilus lindianensis]